MPGEIVVWDLLEEFEEAQRRGWLDPEASHFVEETGETFPPQTETEKEEPMPKTSHPARESPAMAQDDPLVPKPVEATPSSGIFDLMMALELEKPCPDCTGGAHVNPDWARWREDRAAGIERTPPYCPETLRCSRCGGKGQLPTELGQKILDFIRRQGAF